MLKLFRAKTFIKDFNKIKLTDKYYLKFIQYTYFLLNNQPLPKEAKDHVLKGDLNNIPEFHISGDLLVLYVIEDGYLKPLRIGTHSQIFK